jgi:polyphenol oxidase
VSVLPGIHSPLLASVAGVRHAFYTRNGGVSRGLYDSLNVGRGSRDDPAAVEENRRRCAENLGVEAGCLLTCYQSHTADALVADAPWGSSRHVGDAVATAATGLACGALAADCAPVLIVDPQARVIAAAHAGWKGALAGIVASAVARMTELGADPARMVAAVGPCIGPDSYEVGLDFIERFEADAPDAIGFFRPGAQSGKAMFNLPGFVLDCLARAGVTQAEWVEYDTCAEEEHFFSNRRAFKRGEDDYGRLLSAIVLV